MIGLFDNPGGTIKAIAKFCFIVCVVVAAILLFLGLINIASAYDPDLGIVAAFHYTIEHYLYGLDEDYAPYINGYIGKVQCQLGLYLALASLSSIPAYAFGCLVEDVSDIKKKLYQTQKE